MEPQLHTQALEVSKTLKALAHPARLKLLCALTQGERTAGELVEFAGESQSFVSQLLARMRLEGLIESRKQGKFVHYRISNKKVIALMKSIESVFCKKLKKKGD
jgi:DNA-binding transcriptional ArsR family regulator